MNNGDDKTTEQLISELRELNAFQSYLMEKANDGIVILQDGALKWANRKILDLTGLTEGKALGRQFAEFVAPDYKTLVTERYKKRLSGETLPDIYDIDLIGSDGARIPVEINVSVISYYQKPATLCIVRDITERKKAEEKLRHNQALLASVMDGTSDAVFVKDREGKYLFANKAAIAFLGEPAQEIIGRDDTQFFSPAEAKAIMTQDRKVMESKQTQTYEESLTTPDGVKHVFLATKGPVYDNSGDVTGIFGVSRDITERKAVESQLKMREFFFKASQDAAHVGSYSTDFIAGDWESSEVLDQIFGITKEYQRTIAGWLDIVHPDDQEMMNRYLTEEVIGKRQHFNKEYRIKRKSDGEMRWVLGLGEVKFDSAGNIVSMMGTIQDITDRKKIENALVQSSREWQETFDAANDMVCLISRDFEFIKANKRTLEKLGKAKHEVIGKKCYQLIHGLNHPIENCPCQMSLNQGRSQRSEICDKGTYYYATADPLFDDEGKIKAFSHIVTDLTERKQLEAERQKSEKLESISLLAGGIAHDFNNFLTAVIGNIQMAELSVEGKDVYTAKSILVEAEKAAVRAKLLTQQLLTFSKGGTPVKKAINLNKLLRETVVFACSGSLIKPRFSIPNDLCPVEADEGQINQVIQNLVINAGQAMPDGGEIEIIAGNAVIRGDSSLPAGRYVKIDVVDHGLGIPKENRDKIFTPYFTTKQKGNGLGLASSYAIIKKHFGLITFDSEVGAGSTFHVYLPATDTVVKVDAESFSKLSRATTACSVLVMDDEDSIRMLLGRLLKSIGCRVELVKDGQEAIKKYIEARESGNPFDVVILDLTIPGGLGGKDTIARLLEIDPRVKAVVSSGYATDPIMSDYRSYGFSGVVTKPFDINVMKRVVAELINKQ